MRRAGFAAGGVAVLCAVWLWPLPQLKAPAFAAHMTMHMAVVAVAAPLLALSLAGTPWDPVRRAPWLFSAIVASMVELCAVWAWHVPALHHAARHRPLVFGLEQATFLAAGMLLWTAALGGTRAQRRERAFASVTGLLLTSMHMTLLGVLIALTPRVLYAHPHGGGPLPALLDQQLGGVVMLVMGGLAYLSGGLGLAAEVLLSRRQRA